MMLDLNNLEQPYLIAEIGINHNGDLQIAKKLIDAAFACSWDCVKFQKREPDLCVPEHQKGAIRETPWGTMTYIEYKHRIEFSRKEYDYIDKYCKEKPLSWSASVWDIPSMEFIAGYDVPLIKLHSAMQVKKDLLIMACRTGKPIILSTGMSTLEEIDEAVNILCKYASQFALMHANSAYPAPIEDLNIRCIQTLKERYKCEVGYSGHEYGLEPTIFAVAMGAQLLERHITIDHMMWGTDQSASVEVMGMDMLRKRIKDARTILGDGLKVVTKSEISIRNKLRGA